MQVAGGAAWCRADGGQSEIAPAWGKRRACVASTDHVSTTRKVRIYRKSIEWSIFWVILNLKQTITTKDRRRLKARTAPQSTLFYFNLFYWKGRVRVCAEPACLSTTTYIFLPVLCLRRVERTSTIIATKVRRSCQRMATHWQLLLMRMSMWDNDVLHQVAHQLVCLFYNNKKTLYRH